MGEYLTQIGMGILWVGGSWVVWVVFGFIFSGIVKAMTQQNPKDVAEEK